MKHRLAAYYKSLLGRKLNQQPFGVWDDTHPTEPHSQGKQGLFITTQKWLAWGLEMDQPQSLPSGQESKVSSTHLQVRKTGAQQEWT